MRGDGDAVGILEVQISCQSADAVATVEGEKGRRGGGSWVGGGQWTKGHARAGKGDRSHAPCS
jgi:hypothetical protein